MNFLWLKLLCKWKVEFDLYEAEFEVKTLYSSKGVYVHAFLIKIKCDFMILKYLTLLVVSICCECFDMDTIFFQHFFTLSRDWTLMMWILFIYNIMTCVCYYDVHFPYRLNGLGLNLFYNISDIILLVEPSLNIINSLWFRMNIQFSRPGFNQLKYNIIDLLVGGQPSIDPF